MAAVILQFAALPTIVIGLILRIMFSFGLGFGYVRGDWTFKQSLITFIAVMLIFGSIGGVVCYEMDITFCSISNGL